MITKTIKYTDFNGNQREETFYFNLTKAEIMEMELGIQGGLSEKIKRIANEVNTPELISIFKDLILRAYGEKSDDGKHFIKSKEKATLFSQTEAYSELFMELATNSDAASSFINGIVPQEAQTKNLSTLENK